jgi:radical SAM protein with 4Fe4S-binding SPASM domain
MSQIKIINPYVDQIPIYKKFFYKLKFNKLTEKYVNDDRFMSWLVLIASNIKGYRLRKKIKKFYKYEKFNLPYPKMIEIETINKCNMSCSFCPTNKKKDIRKFSIMDEKLFKKIIEEISYIDSEVLLYFHSNNEPLLDKRITEFIQYAKEKLSNTKIILGMSTNGTLLTEEIFLKLSQYLDRLIINNYSENMQLIKTVNKIYNRYRNNQFNADIIINLRNVKEVMKNVGGYSPNYSYSKPINIQCLLPFEQMVIRPDGKISLCCKDVYGQYTLGDISYETIASVWNNDMYNNLRKKMISGRKNIKLCFKCNF